MLKHIITILYNILFEYLPWTNHVYFQRFWWLRQWQIHSLKLRIFKLFATRWWDNCRQGIYYNFSRDLEPTGNGTPKPDTIPVMMSALLLSKQLQAWFWLLFICFQFISGEERLNLYIVFCSWLIFISFAFMEIWTTAWDKCNSRWK